MYRPFSDPGASNLNSNPRPNTMEPRKWEPQKVQTQSQSQFCHIHCQGYTKQKNRDPTLAREWWLKNRATQNPMLDHHNPCSWTIPQGNFRSSACSWLKTTVATGLGLKLHTWRWERDAEKLIPTFGWGSWGIPKVRPTYYRFQESVQPQVRPKALRGQATTLCFFVCNENCLCCFYVSEHIFRAHIQFGFHSVPFLCVQS